MTHIVLSLGSNLNRESNIRTAVTKIQNEFGELEISPVYETEAVGFEGPAFLNLVVGLHSESELLSIRNSLRNFEYESGRVRGKKSFDNRVLDIDVILFGEQSLLGDGLNIPRDEIEKYAYVLKPLSDLYPSLKHPVLGESYKEMWNNFPGSEQQLRWVEFDF